jgi:hypothetical protein
MACNSFKPERKLKQKFSLRTLLSISPIDKVMAEVYGDFAGGNVTLYLRTTKERVLKYWL